MSITPAYCLCTVTTKYFERAFASPQDQRFILKSCVSQFESLIKTIFVSSKVQILQALFHLLNLLYFSRFCYFMDSSNPSQCIFSSTKSFYTLLQLATECACQRTFNKQRSMHMRNVRPNYEKKTCTVFAWRYTVKLLCLHLHHSQLAGDAGAEDGAEALLVNIYSYGWTATFQHSFNDVITQ